VYHRWDITLLDLPSRGYTWDIVFPRAVMRDIHIGQINAIDTLSGDVPWQGMIRRSGDCYHLTGAWRALIRRDCCRCLKSFDWQVEGEVQRNYQLSGGSGDAAEDILLPPGQLSLVDLLREEIWLAWQSDVVCSEQCRGLCSGCGCNLNSEPCRCRKANDNHPFAALRQLKLKD